MTAEQGVLDVPNEAPEELSGHEQVMRLIDTMDLSMVKTKLMDQEEGEGWDREYTEYVELRYKRYLCMNCMNPGGSIVPTKEIDLFWHQHILDTQAYAKDCQTVFGHFLHHFPYFGMRGEEDAKDLLNSFEETKVLYAQLFGDNYCGRYKSEQSSTCHKCSSTCHKCGNSCSGVQCTKCKSK